MPFNWSFGRQTHVDAQLADSALPWCAEWHGHRDLSRLPSREFALRLAEAKAWCDQWGSVTELRSHGFGLEYRGDDDLDSEKLVQALGQARAKALHGQADWFARVHRVAQALPKLGDGRLLVFHFQETISDAFSAAVSGGFFEEDDCPPLATWVGRLNGEHLLCYVPGALIAAADPGIECNAMDCLAWLRPEDWSTYCLPSLPDAWSTGASNAR